MEVVPALGHHPQHLRLLVLAQADRARRAIATHIPVPTKVRELGVGVDDALVKPNDVLVTQLLLVVVVLGHEDYAGQDDTIIGVVIVVVVVVVVVGGIEGAVGAAAEI